MGLKEGDHVWVPHTTEAWVRGTILERKKNDLKVKTDGFGTVQCKVEEVEYCSTNAKQEAKVEDMTQLPDLHNPALLSALNHRFEKDRIYTYTGPILIAVNPFKKIPEIYDAKLMTKYMQSSIEERELLKPHVYAIAHSAYDAMKQYNGRNQSILVSGESGAGKTVSTKIVMDYLTKVSTKSSSNVSQRTLEANPLMEAFGNAKTLRNDNSSRFGKLIQLQFGGLGSSQLQGAAIDIYLLEKARVVHQIKGERNYHIFYEMDKGLSDSEKRDLLFPNLKDCRYTSSGTYERADIKDKKQFKETMQAMEVCGFTSEERNSVFRMVVAVLHLGNVDFDDANKDGAEGSKVSKRSYSSLEACAELLYISPKSLEDALCTRPMSIGGGNPLLAFAAARSEALVKHHTPEQAKEARDAMAMGLYDRLFGWIVWRINESIAESSNGTRPKSTKISGKSAASERYYNDYSIGCLDIFGFEVFEKNSFEQLLINYANESLQGQFNHFIFELEQKEYIEEGIDWTKIEFPDNKKCLEMIESRPIGLISLVDEECLMPRGNDRSLAGKLYDNLQRKFPQHFQAERQEKVNCQFIIHHFAGAVIYDVDGFCAKNKNELRQGVVDAMRTSKNPLFAVLLPPDAGAAGGGADSAEYFSQINSKRSSKRGYRSSLERHRRISPTSSRLQQKTVAAHFKTQLTVAMNHIRASQPHYIRCVKSNDKNVPGIFDRPRVEEQLSYSGVLEVVRVARAGYATRFSIKDFAARFAVLAPQKSKKKQDPRAQCEKILKKAKLVFGDDYQVGHTKVFLRSHAFTLLEIAKADHLRKYVIRLQRFIRAWLVWNRAHKASRAKKKKQRREKNAAQTIQRIVRGMLARKRVAKILKKRRSAARRIKKAYRQKVMRDRLKEIREESLRQRAAVMLQSVARVLKAQKLANNMYAEKVSQNAALQLQSLARMVAAKKTREMMEQEREAEMAAMEGEETNGQLTMFILPMAILFLFSNPFLVIGLAVIAVAMLFGAGLGLEASMRQREYDDLADNYARRARRHRRGRQRSIYSDSEDEEDDTDMEFYRVNSKKSAKKTLPRRKNKNQMDAFDDYNDFYNKKKASSKKKTTSRKPYVSDNGYSSGDSVSVTSAVSPAHRRRNKVRS